MTAAVAERATPPAMNEMPSPEWREVRKLTLAAVPSAVGCTRLLVQHALTRWQLDEHRATAIEGAACALVSHAVETTGVIEKLPTYNKIFDCLTLIKVRLVLEPDRAIIEVWDSGSAPPAESLARQPVIAASDAWGFDLPARQHRVVWCVLPNSGESNSEEAALLPRRMPRRVPRMEGKRPAQATRDPRILRRVLDGLRKLDRTPPEALNEQGPRKPPGGD